MQHDFNVRVGSSRALSGLRAQKQKAVEAGEASDTGRLAARTRRISLSRTKSWEKARLSKKCSRCSSPRVALASSTSDQTGLSGGRGRRILNIFESSDGLNTRR